MVRSLFPKLSSLVERSGLPLTASLIAREVGLEALSVLIARHAQQIGDSVPVRIPGAWPHGRFVLQACGGRDLVARSLWFEGWSGFEKPLPDLIAAFARRVSGTFLDIGANTGLYSLIVKRANPGLSVYAFEPFPPVFDLLKRNIELNGCTGSITLEQFALGAADGEAQLFVPLQDHGVVESSCSLNAGFKEAHSAALTVPVTTVDSYLTKHRVTDLALLKVDVEGHEHAVFSGASASVKQNRPIIFYELLPQADNDMIEKFRQDHGYVSYQLHPTACARETSTAFHADAWNHLMAPAEQTALVERTIAECHLGLVR